MTTSWVNSPGLPDIVSDDDVDYKSVHWKLDNYGDQHSSHHAVSEPLRQQ